VHLQALQPGTTVGRIGATVVAAESVDQLATWDHVRVLHRHTWRIADRLGLDLRLHVRQGPNRWECEQRIYLDINNGLVDRIEVLSSGCHLLPAEDPDFIRTRRRR
jgi:hypothetical protein